MPSEAGPAGSPASQPMQPQGLEQMAAVKVNQIIKVLEQTLPAFGSGSEQGAGILKALQALNKAFPASESEPLGNAQMLQLMTSTQQGQGGPQQ